MADEALRYKKLPGIGRRFIEYHRLFVGPDHLLQVSSMFVHETYKRFYYHDIQAVIIRQNNKGNVTTAIQSFFLLFFLSLALATDGAARAAMLIVSSFFVIALLVHLLLGKTVSTHLRTAVQLEPLHSLHRLPQARRALRRIQPMIDAAQPQAAPPPESPATPGTESAPSL